MGNLKNTTQKKKINLNQSYKKEQKSRERERESTHNFYVEKNMD